ncbi:(deoxy)nucleoside triphosphate pyrophosphohydrolase [Agromyces sp. NPDC056379]|uniref:(deoxy)nucleoside triphosphate pyrophosphohydrolase n=1 Tax=unclassified Agromyces TaxID=2639701 RepID=UPI0035E0B85F
MTVELEVVAGAIFDEGQLFACRRAPGKAAAGRWEFPGGKIEVGEDPRAALARELHEELEVDVAVGDLLDRSQTRVGDVIIDLATYEVTLLDSRPVQSTDHDRLGWFDLNELVSLDWAEPDLPAVAALIARSSS